MPGTARLHPPLARRRPSLGGVARRTRETMLLCEAAGFDVIIVESVGVGQGEIALRSMVDFFLLLLLPGAGDELQGIKKGIVELADLVLINKADGDNRLRAEQSRQEQANALHYTQPPTSAWKTEVGCAPPRPAKALPRRGSASNLFITNSNPKASSPRDAASNLLQWLAESVQEGLRQRFYQNPRVQAELSAVREAVLRGELTVPGATQLLLAAEAETISPTLNESPQL